jgi:hypothetical protein
MFQGHIFLIHFFFTKDSDKFDSPNNMFLLYIKQSVKANITLIIRMNDCL